MISNVLRIAVIGPESTGKSVLSEQLADFYKTVWVKEYARKYLTLLQKPYTLNDIIEIYKTQYLQEKELMLKANRIIFTDTEFIIAKVWCEHVFDNCPDEIESAMKNYPYDFYILTAPDLPWEYDPLRENPGKGEFFFNWYKKILDERNLNYGVVKGTGTQRLQNAIELVEQLLVK